MDPVSPQTDNEWSVSSALRILNAALAQAGISYQNLELLRFGTAATYRLHPDPIVVRVTRPGSSEIAARREHLVPRWLQQNGFPVAPQLDIPVIQVQGSTVSFWKWMAPYNDRLNKGVPPIATPVEFANLLKGLHQLGGTPGPEITPEAIGLFNPFESISALLSEIESNQNIQWRDIKLLKDWQALLIDKYNREVEDPNYSSLGLGVIHGDAHIGNTYRSEKGLFLLDFDYACFGPREWDLIPAALEVRRFGQPREKYYEFSQTYGFDVSTWRGFETLAMVRELFMTVWRINVEKSASVHKESQIRLDYWRKKTNPGVWHSF